MQIGHQNKLSQTDIATLEGNFKLKMLTLFHPAISSACVHETQHPGEFTVALGVSEKHRACRQAHVVQWGRDGPTGHQAEPVRASEGILGMEKAATVRPLVWIVNALAVSSALIVCTQNHRIQKPRSLVRRQVLSPGSQLLHLWAAPRDANDWAERGCEMLWKLPRRLIQGSLGGEGGGGEKTGDQEPGWKRAPALLITFTFPV